MRGNIAAYLKYILSWVYWEISRNMLAGRRCLNFDSNPGPRNMHQECYKPDSNVRSNVTKLNN